MKSIRLNFDFAADIDHIHMLGLLFARKIDASTPALPRAGVQYLVTVQFGIENTEGTNRIPFARNQ